MTPEAGDPLAETEAWLKAHAASAGAITRTIQTARNGGAPTLAMLAHLATVAQAALRG